jgi:hypothetical protein
MSTTKYDGDPTDGEIAFLKSGGQDTSGLSPDLFAELEQQPTEKAQDGGGQPNPTPSAAEGQSPASGAPTAEQAEPGELVIDETGRAHRPDGKFAKKQRVVPHEALHAERETRRSLEKELREVREEAIANRERLRMLQEAAEHAMRRQQEPEGPSNPLEEPDVDENVDLFAALQQERRRNKYLAEQQAQAATGIQKSAEERAMQEFAKADATAFAQEKPDFWHAYNHLLNARGRELEMYGMNREQILAQVRAEEQQMIKLARQRNMRPSQYIYQLANLRGWNPAMMQQQQGQAPNPAANGHAPPPTQQPAPQPQAPSPAMQRMQQQAQTRQQFTSLSGGGGSPAIGFTAAALEAMTQAEFDAAVNSMNPSQLRALMGG